MPRDNRDRGDSSRREAGRARAYVRRPAPEPEQPPISGERDPLKVQLVSGDRDFFEALRQTLGVPSSTQPQSGNAEQDRFAAVIASQEAMTEATRQIGTELKATMAMLRDLQVSSSSAPLSDDAEGQRDDRRRMDRLLQILSHQQGGGMGGGGGGPEYGEHSYLTSSQNYTTSRGELARRVRSQVEGRMDQTADQVEQIEKEGGAPLGGPMGWLGMRMGAAGMRRMGTGLSTAGMGGLLRAAPVVGTGLAVASSVNSGASWLTDQRAANAQYQSVLGGDNVGGIGDLGDFFGGLGGNTDSRSGLGNRLAEEGYVLGQRFSRGGLDEAQSREAFKGVTGLGYTGQRRERALTEIEQSYEQLGVSTQETMQLLATSAQYAESSMTGLNEQLGSVTETAERTGQSAVVLRENFSQVFSSALQFGAGGASGQVAQSYTNMTGSGGRMLAGANPLSALQDPQNLYMTSHMMGMSPSQLQARAETEPWLLMEAQGRRSERFMDMLGRDTQRVIDRSIKEQGGKQAVAGDQGLQDEVANQVMLSDNYDITTARYAVTQIDPQFAQGASDEQIMHYIVNHQAGNNPTQQAKKLKQQMTPKALTDQAIGERKGPAAKYVKQGMERDQSASIWEHIGDYGRNEEADYLQESAGAYRGMLANTNKTNPIVEKLMKQFGDDPSVRFKVQTADGEKAVKLSEAIKHFPDQLTSGSAVIMHSNEDLNNRSVKNEVGAIDPKAAGLEGGTKNKEWEGSDPKLVAKDLRGEDAEKESSGGGEVTISLSPEAKRLFNVQTSGGARLNESAASGRPSPQSTGPK